MQLSAGKNELYQSLSQYRKNSLKQNIRGYLQKLGTNKVKNAIIIFAVFQLGTLCLESTSCFFSVV